MGKPVFPGIHTSYIGSHLKPVVFPTKGTSLSPAFTPEMVNGKGKGVGTLGGCLNDCLKPPTTAPCGGTGDLGAVLKGEGGSNVVSNGNGSSSSGTTGPTYPSTSALAFTGGAGTNFGVLGGLAGGFTRC